MSKKSINIGNIMLYIIKEKNQVSKITTNTYFIRLRKASKLKFAPLFAPVTNLIKQI